MNPGYPYQQYPQNSQLPSGRRPSQNQIQNTGQNYMNRTQQLQNYSNYQTMPNQMVRSTLGSQNKIFPHFEHNIPLISKIDQQQNKQRDLPKNQQPQVITSTLEQVSFNLTPIISTGFNQPKPSQKVCQTINQIGTKKQQVIQTPNINIDMQKDQMKSAIVHESKQFYSKNKSVIVQAVTSSVQYISKVGPLTSSITGASAINDKSKINTDYHNKKQGLTENNLEQYKTQQNLTVNQKLPSQLPTMPIMYNSPSVKPTQFTQIHNPQSKSNFNTQKNIYNDVSQFGFASILPSSPPLNLQADYSKSNIPLTSIIIPQNKINSNVNNDSMRSKSFSMNQSTFQPSKTVGQPNNMIPSPQLSQKVEQNAFFQSSKDYETYTQSLGSIKSIIPPFINDDKSSMSKSKFPTQCQIPRVPSTNPINNSVYVPNQNQKNHNSKMFMSQFK